MGRRVSSGVFVGRRQETEFLLAAVAAAAAGRGACVLVDGEAGIGKTRLLRDFTASAEAVGATVLVGSCLPFARAVPYAPVLDLLDSIAPGAVPAGGGRSGRAGFFHGVLERLLAAAGSGPVVAVLDDLHWADDSTGDLFLYLADASPRHPVVVVGSRRLDQPEESPRLIQGLHELVRAGRAERIALGPLGRADVEQLLEDVLGVAPSPGLLDRVTARAEGNPFFTEELVAAGGGDELPETVRELLIERLARTGEATRRALQVVSVIGRETGHGLLDAVVSDRGGVDDALREAVRHRLIEVSGERYSFRHALVHEAVYGDLLPGERRALHERVAVALTERPDLSGGRHAAQAEAELAHHWHAAGRHDEAIAASVAAGRAADASYAPAEALAHYRRAIELWPLVIDPDGRAGVSRRWLLDRAAEAATLAGDHLGAALLLGALAADLDPDRDAESFLEVLERQAMVLWYAGDADAALAAAVEIGRRLRVEPTAERADALSAMAGHAHLSGRYRECIAAARQAYRVAVDVGATLAQSRSLNALGASLSRLGCHDGAIDTLEKSLKVSQRTGDGNRIASAWYNLAEAHNRAGRCRAAIAIAERAVVEIERLGLVQTYLPMTVGELSWALSVECRWDEANRLAEESLRGDIEAYFAASLLVRRAQSLIRQGRYDEASVALDRIESDGHGEYDPLVAGFLAARRADVAVGRGDWAAARTAVATGLAALAQSEETLLVVDLHAIGARAEADASADALLAKRSVSIDLARSAADDHVAESTAWLARVAATTGCRSEHFARYVELARAERSRLDDPRRPEPWAALADGSSHDPFVAAYARWREAEALLATKASRRGGEVVLRDAYASASTIGAVPVADGLVALARRARVELGAPVSTDDGGGGGGLASYGLTARELEVLRLVGRGLTNAEIATALFISAKTASVHVTHILQKVGVASRIQAAAIAHRAELD